MSTLLLRPQHCLRDPFHHESLPSSSLKSLKSRKNPESLPSSSLKSLKSRKNPRIQRSGDRRKRSPSYDSSDSGRSTTTNMVVKSPVKKLVMGEVKILKRGESIDEETSKLKLGHGDGDSSDLFSRSRLGPEPEMIPKEIRLTDLNLRSIDEDVEKFAGCGFVASPSPSLVPIPVFIPQVKAAKLSLSLPKATENIRRMLHL